MSEHSEVSVAGPAPFTPARCPACLADNPAAEATCPRCGAATAWPTREAYRSHLVGLKRGAVRGFQYGAVEVVLACVALVLLAVLFRRALRMDLHVAVVVWGLLGLGAAADGVRRCLHAGRRILHH